GLTGHPTIASQSRMEPHILALRCPIQCSPDGRPRLGNSADTPLDMRHPWPTSSRRPTGHGLEPRAGVGWRLCSSQPPFVAERPLRNPDRTLKSVPWSTLDGHGQLTRRPNRTLRRRCAVLSDFDIAFREFVQWGTGSWANALIDSLHRDDMNRLAVVIRAKCDVNEPIKDGITPLHIAALEGSAQAVRYLVGCGARVNAR